MLDIIKSITFGHAIGDALGVPVEFCGRKSLKMHPINDMIGYGTYNMPAGTWSDDTSMSLCALDSLSEGKIDYDAIMVNFGKWYYNEEFTATDCLFDIGNTCREAISNYCNKGYSVNECGISDIYSNGNGSLMRIYPFVLYAYYNKFNSEDLIDMISKASALTHAHQYSIDGCIIYAYILIELIKNPTKKSIYIGINKAMKYIKSHNIYDEFINNDIINLTETEIKSGGYVADTLKASIWCLLTTNSYKDCVLKAVNLGEDTDTTGAVVGSLAGMLYGFDNIPKKWLKILKKEKYIEHICQKAYETWGGK